MKIYQEIENDKVLISEVITVVQNARQNYGDPEAGWCGDNNLEIPFGEQHFAAFKRYNDWARVEKQKHNSFHLDWDEEHKKQDRENYRVAAKLDKMGCELVPAETWHTYVLFMKFARLLPNRNPDVRYIDLHAFGTGWGEMFNGWHNLGSANTRPRAYRAALHDAVHAALCEEGGVAERVLGVVALTRITA